MTMTCNGDENSKQYLLTPSTHDSFKWYVLSVFVYSLRSREMHFFVCFITHYRATIKSELIYHLHVFRSMFVARTLRGPELSETRGYWKILYRENNEKYASRDDLTRIRSLVLHQQIAPKLLDYKKKTAFESTNLNEDHPFKESFKVWLHTKSDSDSESDEGIIKYEVKFWNGASLNQTHAYKIVKIESGKTNYYQYFDASLKHDQIKWLWYDNNNSRYQYFELGPDTNQQLECSFQSNLIYNYPVNIHSDIDDGQYFNNCSLPYLRKGFSEYMEKNGEDISKLNYKTYLLRTTFHRQPREYRYIHMLEQVTVSEHAFPRTVQRRDHSITAKGEDERKYGVEDYCIDINRHYNLRMEPL